jgi:exodeoxyribonuclease-3
LVRIASWNVNSVKAHITNVLSWLRAAKPDAVLLQEIKTTDDAFPRLEIEDLGYNLAIVGQKTYNGWPSSRSPLTWSCRRCPAARRSMHAA